MTTVLTIIGIGAAIFFVFTLLNGGSGKEAVGGAAAGGLYAAGCMLQLIIGVLPILAGLWLLNLIFG